ncbi:MAG: glutathione binding-like protein, partial [Pseudomonadota bacterium]|nr:glutathione binding-like protein [Pseudomonadota bacterium]
GEAFSAADILLLTTVDFAKFVGLDMPGECATLAAWHERVSARPSASA